VLINVREYGACLIVVLVRKDLDVIKEIVLLLVIIVHTCVTNQVVVVVVGVVGRKRSKFLINLYMRKNEEARVPLHSNLWHNPNYSQRELDSDMNYFRTSFFK